MSKNSVFNVDSATRFGPFDRVSGMLGIYKRERDSLHVVAWQVP